MNKEMNDLFRFRNFPFRYRPMRSASMRETSYSRSIRRRRRNDSVSVRSSFVGEVQEVNNNGN